MNEFFWFFVLFLGSEKESSSPDKKGRDNESLAEEKIPYPKSVFLIIATEFCERFSYYGMRSELFLKLFDCDKQSLKYFVDLKSNLAS